MASSGESFTRTSFWLGTIAGGDSRDGYGRIVHGIVCFPAAEAKARDVYTVDRPLRRWPVVGLTAQTYGGGWLPVERFRVVAFGEVTINTFWADLDDPETKSRRGRRGHVLRKPSQECWRYQMVCFAGSLRFFGFNLQYSRDWLCWALAGGNEMARPVYKHFMAVPGASCKQFGLYVLPRRACSGIESV